MIEYLMNITFAIPLVGWSLYPFISLLICGGLLIYLAMNSVAREKIERKIRKLIIRICNMEKKIAERKRIAFKPHETRGQEIIKILEYMGGVNKYNLDGSKGIIAIDNLSIKSISNDWDYCGLIMNGWKVYTLEEWEGFNVN